MTTLPPKKRKSAGYHPKFASLLIAARPEFSPFITTFLYKPENIEQQRLGSLFGLIKIDDLSEDSSYITNLLASVIKKEYFSKPHRTAEESFEASLRKANLALAELARHGSVGWAGKINFAGGALERNNLHLVTLGDVSVHLIRRSDIAEISEELSEAKESESHPLKTFSNISSGKLESGDKLIFSTGELKEIFSAEELRQNAMHFSADEFPGFLEISFQANSEMSSAIVVDLLEKPQEKIAPTPVPILAREKIKALDSFVQQPSPTSGNHYPSKAQAQQTADEFGYLPEKESKLESFLARLKKIPMSVQSAAQIFLEKSKIIWGKNSGFRRTRATQSQMSSQYLVQFPLKKNQKIAVLYARLASGLKNQLRKIDFQNKKLLTGIGVFLALLIVVSGLILGLKARNNAKKSTTDQTTSSETTPVLAAANDVNAKEISLPVEVSTLSQSVSRMAILAGTIYLPAGKSVLKIDPQTGTASEMLSGVGTGNFRFIAAMPDLATLFIFTDDNKIVSLTPINKNFQENSIALPDNLKPADIKTYLTYLYFLDPINNQIMRFPRAEGGFGEGHNWLKSGSDVKNGKSFAINDDLFVATNTDIIALLQGKPDSQIGFEKSNVELAIDDVYTEPGFSGIYVLDNQNHRIVEFDKQGKIMAQFVNQSISGVKDFVVDEKNKTIYLLEGNQILKFGLE